MKTNLSKSIIAPSLIVTAVMGCSDDDPVVVEPRVGTVEFSWTIEGETDPDSCEEFGAEVFEIVLIDNGYYARGFEIPCEDFSGSVAVVVDDYVARMTLVDAEYIAVTERVVSSAFSVTEGEKEQLEVDFPASSFED